MVKHQEKILVAICLAFYAWGFIDDRFRHWSFIGGYSTFIAFIVVERKSKGRPLVDLAVIMMIAGVLILLGIQILTYMRG
ncbi:hypothetical protein [Oligoflexus tunisiensis]|uniref:hypothetical protein n=1 Tax=Oligoflexus tunisiensis TaxID=708132 RepID=UPI00114CB5A1|nr:hypothetical protein [Oligoflexus tunisiensis]